MPKKSLFSQHSTVSSGPKDLQVEAHVTDVPRHYAVTVNLHSQKKVNRKAWFRYTDDQQRGILTRIEYAFRRDTPSVKLHSIAFEKAPSSGNIHFHALYEMLPIFQTTVENYWSKHAMLGEHDNPWRHLDIRIVHNIKGWMDYINKEQV